MRKQQTVLRTHKLTGIGIHSGKKTSLIIKPGPENTGIVFIRTDLTNARIKVSAKNLILSSRATMLSKNNVKVSTPEHLLASCYGCHIDNLQVELTHEEVPIMDGSAIPFVEAIQKCGSDVQSSLVEPITIKKCFRIEENHSYIEAKPYPTTKFTYYIEYPNHFIGSQSCSFEITQETFIKEIAPARTYGFLEEIETLHKNGLGLGGTLKNAVVIGKTHYLTPLRFDNELSRHKLLDMIGDLSILERPINGHIIGYKSGHKLNQALVKKISLDEKFR